MKTIIDIENASAGALKADMAEAMEIAAGTEVNALASRYVQARLDATTRDELLLDQGDTITTIKRALADKGELANSERERADKAEALLIESRAATNRVDGEAKAEIAELEAKTDAKISALTIKYTEAVAELSDKSVLAKSRRVALAEVVDTATQAIADISAVANRLLSEE